MARQARLDHENAVHHVMGRGIEKRPIYTDGADRTEFLRRLAAISRQCRMRVYAWSLMPNHFHLLLQRTTVPLSMGMQRLLCGYAQWFNRRHERAGRLFQNRYKSKLVQTELYLARLVRYIHGNPVRAGIVTADDLSSYRWTGHAVLMGRRRGAWQDTDTVLSYFGDSDEEARESLEEYMTHLEPNPEEIRRWVWMLSFGGRRRKCPVPAIGSDEFRSRMAAAIDDSGASAKRTHPGQLAAIITELCSEFNVSRLELASGKRGKSLSRARAVGAYLGTGVLGLTCAQASRFLGVTPQSVNISAKKGQRLLREEVGISRRLLSRISEVNRQRS